MPLISIILPIYNAEKYLKKCLVSLLNQTLSDIEILCINDGSTDNSLAILEEFKHKDSRIKVFKQINAGPASARNLGLKYAQGKYIMFCDADDWYQPNMCENMYDFMEQNEVDVACCGVNVFDDDKLGKRIDSLDYYLNKYTGLIEINEAIISKTNVVLWNKIFKKSLIEQYDISFPNNHECDDDCFYLKYMSVAKNIFFTDLRLYNYFRHSDSILGTYFQKKLKYVNERLYISKDYHSFLLKNKIFSQNCFVFYQYLSSVVSKELINENLTEAKQIFTQLFNQQKELFNLVFYKKLFSCFGISLDCKILCKKRRFLKKYFISFHNKQKLSFKTKYKYPRIFFK